jgi:hypothetical protein
MLLIDDLLLAPITGFQFIMRTLIKAAEEEWTNDAPLKEQLLALQIQLDAEEITEEQYVAMEAEILRELRNVQERKMQLAGVDPDQFAGGLSGTVKEGSGAELTFTPPPEDEEGT